MRTNEMRRLARWLLIYEAGDRLDENSLIEAAERASEKLRIHMSQRIGVEGCRTLLTRSLSLTVAEYPDMATVQLSPQGSLVGLRGTSSVDGAVAILNHFYNLLVTFIGEEITLRIIGTVWPEFEWDETAGAESESE